MEIFNSRLEARRDHGDAYRLPAGEEGRGRIHLHRREQRGSPRVPGLPQGHRPAPGPAASQSDVSGGPRGGEIDMFGLWGPAP